MTMRDQILIGTGVAAAIALGLAAWLLLAPAPSPSSVADPLNGPALAGSMPAIGSPAPSIAELLIVDVEGGVRRPGIVQLAAGSRVGDAIAAAGGYAKRADLDAAASLNLAAALSDGQQVYVPLTGVASGGGLGAAGAGTGGTPAPVAGGGGLVNINTASPEQLDTLPDVGPVTVQKIVAARQEQPFTSLEEMVTRKVIDNGQLEKIRGLVTF